MSCEMSVGPVQTIQVGSKRQLVPYFRPRFSSWREQQWLGHTRRMSLVGVWCQRLGCLRVVKCAPVWYCCLTLALCGSFQYSNWERGVRAYIFISAQSSYRPDVSLSSPLTVLLLLLSYLGKQYTSQVYSCLQTLESYRRAWHSAHPILAGWLSLKSFQPLLMQDCKRVVLLLRCEKQLLTLLLGWKLSAHEC